MRKTACLAVIAVVLFATPVLAQPVNPPPDVPEPATIGLIALGAGALAMTLRSKRK